MPKYNNPTAYSGRSASDEHSGQARFATDAEAIAGTATDLIVTPSALAGAVDDLLPAATTTVAGKVELATAAEMSAGVDTGRVPAVNVAYDYINSVAIAGAPAWSESQSGIGQLSTSAEATTGTNDDTAMTPLKVAAVMAAPPAIGSGTPAAGSFTTLSATGVIDFDAGGSIESGGANAIDIGADANTDAINIGTGAAARTITMGNVSGATAVAINSGTGHITLTSTGAGDIIINSDDTLLLDADGVLELNSSGGAIGIGSDADAQAINVGTGAAARTITIGNGTGATSLVLNCGTGALNIGSNAIARTITIGNNTGASGLVLACGTGNFSLDGATGSTYNIGAATTTGTVTIGGTSQTGNFILGPSDGAMTMSIANSDGAKTINVGAGVNGNTISVGNGINTSAQVINVAGGASAANSTVNILSGNGSAGTQTLNALTGNRAGALNLATGAAAHVIAVGSASAGAITVDTAAGISLDAATASNFTVTGAADLTLQTTAGSLNLLAGEDDAACIVIEADAGISERIYIHSDQGTGNDSVFLESDVGGITLTSGKADAAAIDINAASGGMTVDCGLGISLDAAGASNLSVSGAGIDLTLASSGGRAVINGEEAADDAIRLLSAAGGLDCDVALSCVITSSESNADSMQIVSGGGVDITATGGAAKDIDIACTSGSVNISAGEADAAAIVLNASNAAGGIDISTGGGSVDISSAGLVSMVAGTDSQAGDTCTINTNVFAATYTGFTTAAAASQVFTITNSLISTTSQVLITVSNLGSNDAQMTMTRVKQAAGSVAVTCTNNGAAALNGNVVITGWVIG